MRTGLSHPVSVDNGTLTFASEIIVPMPSFGVDGFAYCTENAERGKVVILYVFLAHSTKQTDSCGRSVQVSGLPFVDKVPVSRGGRVYGCTLKDGSGDAVRQRSVDDVGVTRDPSDIRHTGKLIIGVDVEDVFDR